MKSKSLPAKGQGWAWPIEIGRVILNPWALDFYLRNGFRNQWAVPGSRHLAPGNMQTPVTG